MGKIPCEAPPAVPSSLSEGYSSQENPPALATKGTDPGALVVVDSSALLHGVSSQGMKTMNQDNGNNGHQTPRMGGVHSQGEVA